MVVALQGAYLGAQRAAHDEPLDELGTLRPGERDQLADRLTRDGLRIVDYLLETEEVERLVDESGAFAVELVREAARPEHDHALVAGRT